MKPLKSLTILALLAVSLLLTTALPSCSSTLEPIQNTCKGVDCSGHGECRIQGGKAVCVCDQGYHAEGLACVEDDNPCAGIDCSGHGSCVIQGYQAACECDPGYEPDGLSCVKACSNDAECDDDNACTYDHCDQGSCLNTDISSDCNDENPCTDDSCEPDSGCVNNPIDEDLECDDGNACTDDYCEPDSGCVHNPDEGRECNDGKSCTLEDVCSSGECIGGPPPDCSGTSSQCRADSTCDPAGSEGNCDIPGTPINEGLACNDGNACTVDETCSDGICTGGQTVTEGTSCDDGDACTLDDVCSSGVCTGDLIDADGDGIPPESCGGPDCDDGDPLVSGESEVFLDSHICTNGIDDDCDGKTDGEDFGCVLAVDLCTPDGWCRDNPLDIIAEAIWGSGQSDIWISGYKGIYHFDGQTLRLSGEGAYLTTDLWGTSDTDVWLTGKDRYGADGLGTLGIVRRWDGNTWNDEFPCEDHTDFRPYALWGLAQDDLWLAGRGNPLDFGVGGYILHWNGSYWSQSLFRGEYEPRGFGGSGPDDVWAVGIVGQILHWNGYDWHEEYSGTEENLHSVVSWGPNDAWAVGSYGSILHWNGVRWSVESPGVWNPPLGKNVIWGLSTDDIWVCGGGASKHWDGIEWTDSPFGCSDIWGTAPDDLWRVNWYEGVAHWDGTSWTQIPQAITYDDLEDVFGEDNSNVWAVGDQVVLRRDGRNWNKVWSGLRGKNLNSVWASSADNAWVVGENGYIAHFDGGTWNDQDSGTTASLHTVWGTGSDSIWAAGTLGTILRWSGASWSDSDSGTIENLVEVHGSSENNVWAVGENATVLKWDGQSWAQVALPFQPGDVPGEATCDDLLVFSENNVWVTVDDADTYSGVYRWDGTQWSHLWEGQTSIHLGGTQPDNVWLGLTSGDGMDVYSWNGIEWTSRWQWLREVRDLVVTQQGAAFLVGTGGVILRYSGCSTDSDCIEAKTCLQGRVCTYGLCSGGTPAPEGSPCDDQLFCNGTDTCDANGLCSVHTGDPCLPDDYCEEYLNNCSH